MRILCCSCLKFTTIGKVGTQQLSLHCVADLVVEHGTAADFVDRALFTYERAFVGAFNFTSGVNRLDFDHVENRPLFLALHRQIMYVRG